MTKILEAYRPYDAGAGANVTEAGWRKMGGIWTPDGPRLDVANYFETYGDSSGLQTKTKTGECWIQGHQGENQAEHPEGLDAVGGIPGSETRIDRIILRNDFVNNRIEITHLTGTAAASPVAPSLTQSSALWEIALARITGIDNATTLITAGMVTDERAFTAAALGVPKAATVPTLETTTSTSYTDLATAGPTVTIQTGTRALVTVGARMRHNTINGLSHMGVGITGATTLAAADARAVSLQSYTSNGEANLSKTFLVEGLTPGSHIFTAKYKLVVAGTAGFEHRSLVVTPLA